MSLPENQRKLDVVQQLAQVADDAGVSMIELAIAFVVNHPAVTSAIIGPRTMEQLDSQLPAADVVLDAATLDRIWPWFGNWMGRVAQSAARESSGFGATAHRWWHRWLEADAAQRASGRWLRTAPVAASPAASTTRRARGADLRRPRATGWGRGGRRRDRASARRRSGRCSARTASRADPRPARGAQPLRVACPGDLLHMDVCRYPRFRRPGTARPAIARKRDRHWMPPRPESATTTPRDRRRPLRLAYVELHDDERAATVTAFVDRALAFFADHSITPAAHDRQTPSPTPRTARCASYSPRTASVHLTTQPYRPRTNGKVERFHQTMGREWAHGRSYPTSDAPSQPPERLARALQPPATALSDRQPPPITRVHNL
jgi:hypothetical protein